MDYLIGKIFLLPFKTFSKNFRIVVKRLPSFHQFNASFRVCFTCYLDAQSKTIKKLGPKLPFFRVHGAYQDKAGRVPKGYAFTLNYVFTGAGRV